jgi:2-methylisocitrate lyase-like PEP mutase family enzyme
MRPGLDIAELAELGVRRISLGGSLARVALGAMLSAAERIKAGSLDGLDAAVSGKRLNDTFRRYPKGRSISVNTEAFFKTKR